MNSQKGVIFSPKGIKSLWVGKLFLDNTPVVGLWSLNVHIQIFILKCLISWGGVVIEKKISKKLPCGERSVNKKKIEETLD